jgi:flagellar motor switch protein FliG
MIDLLPRDLEIYQELTMTQKIAILLMKFGEDTTATIFAHMDTATISEVSKAIVTSSTLSASIVNAVFSEFYAIFQSQKYISSGGLSYAKEVLYKSLDPKQAQLILDKLTRDLQNHKNFNYLDKIRPQQLATFIGNEHPQTIALVLAYMDYNAAAETLNFLPDDQRAEISIRMANLGDISPEIIRKVSVVLEGKLEALSTYKVEVGGARAVAEIFNRLGQKNSKSTLTYIEQVDEGLATEIKELMFTFEDIVKLDNNGIRELLKEVDKKDLSLGLKSASEDLKQKILSNMSQRAAETFVEEMQFLGAVKVKDVESSQRRIVEKIQELAEKGTIQMGEEDAMVE